MPEASDARLEPLAGFVGRAEPLRRLTAAFAAVARASEAAAPPAAARAGLVLVTGEAGIGKTALLRQFATQAAQIGATVAWGSCWEGDQTPAWWPWTQALRSLLEQRPALGDGMGTDLAAILPESAVPAPAVAADAAHRVHLLDAVARLLRQAGADGPVVVILDDLQWSDLSTVDLLRFLAGQGRTGPLLLVGAYRPEDPRPEIAAGLAELAVIAELVVLSYLSAGEVAELVHAVAGSAARDTWPRLVLERSAGHPFYARELCRMLAADGAVTELPHAVREVIGQRLSRLSPSCRAMLDVAAVGGGPLLPDVLAEVAGVDLLTMAELIAEGERAAVLRPRSGSGAGGGHEFTHDLYRETCYGQLAPRQRIELHHRLAQALARRRERGHLVFAADVARHLAAGLPLAALDEALAWAHAAADVDASRFAFAEAAGHLSRAGAAAAACGLGLSVAERVGLLTAEADLRLRAGDAPQARLLLDEAWGVATGGSVPHPHRGDGRGPVEPPQPQVLGAVALGLDRVDARFGMPRPELISRLESARSALRDSGTPAEAQVTAALARQLQHSVPGDRRPARALAQAAVAIARRLDDPVTLASCLLAEHDTLWTPGAASERAELALEIGELARQAGDAERHAQALLLLATARLEEGSAAFRAVLAEYSHATQQLRQPRHDYLLATRRAALALIDGDIETGDQLSAEAAALGEAVGDSDARNVRMSQRLEVVRARNDPAELLELAAEAVQWWVGVPIHAHAVAAGFRARAGDLDGAAREVEAVRALGDWRADRSYLWSVFVGELAAAAIALADRPLCLELLDELLPLADTCAVNGALVCFMGAHAHTVGLLHAALGDQARAVPRLRQALRIHERLGAKAWQLATQSALAALGGPEVPRPSAAAEQDGPRLERVGDMWRASYRGGIAFLRDAKGLHDLAALLARPGVDVPALELAGASALMAAEVDGGDPVLDAAALRAYRRRLTELDAQLDRADGDLGRRQRAIDEREQLLAQLRSATRPGGRTRSLGVASAERARKAVSARVRDAIRRIEAALPEFGRHLDRSIRTGVSCRYDPAAPAP